MATKVETRFVLAPGWEAIFATLPGVVAANQRVAHALVTRMKANVHGPGTQPFRREAFVDADPQEPGTWRAGTKWPIAHVLEFGAVTASPHGWLRNAAASTPSTRFVPA